MNIRPALPFEIAIYNTYPKASELNSSFMIVAVLRGSVQLTHNQAIYDMHAGELLFLKPQDHFSISMDEQEQPIAAFIFFHYNFFLKNIPYATEGINMDPKNYSAKAYRELFVRTVEFIDRHFDTHTDSLQAGSLYAYDYLCFLQTFIASQTTRPETLSKKEQRILHIRDFMERNYASAVTLNDLAGELNITPQYLATFIHQNLHMTFNQYLYKIRLSYAVRDLVNTTDSITHIAYNYGFPNLAAFNRIFKEEYKKTPQSYRAQYRKNLDYLDVLPPENAIPDYETSKTLYLSFKAGQQEIRKNETDIDVKEMTGHPLPHIWTKILNVGYGKEINDFSFQEQLQTLTKEIPFEYGRIYGLFHPDMIPYDSSMRTWNYHKVDTVLDIVTRCHLKPFIVLGKPEPVFNAQGYPVYAYSANDFPDFSKAFRAFVRHLIQRYGIDTVEQWAFEYSYNMVEEGYFSKNQFYYNFLKSSAEAWHILKGISPNFRFGGPGHRLAQAEDPLMHILSCWEKDGIQPDFITINAYPLERTANENHRIDHKYSPDPFISRKRMLQLKGFLQDAGYEAIPIYIIEMAFTFLNKKMLSDSLFPAVYTVQNILGLCDLCQCITLPTLSDLHYSRLGYTGLLGGHNGIYSIDGIRKPLFFALLFMHNLGNERLMMSDNYIATRHRDGSLRLLMYNYKHPNNYFCAHPDYEITEHNFDTLFSDAAPATFNFHPGVLTPGKYFIMEYTLTREFGSLLDKWLEGGRDRLLLPHIIYQLRLQMDVHFMYHIVDIGQDTVLHYTLKPLEMKLVCVFSAD